MKILILQQSLAIGGAEKILINYLKILLKDYKIDLLVKLNKTQTDQEYAFFEDISHKVTFCFAKNKKTTLKINKLDLLREQNQPPILSFLYKYTHLTYRAINDYFYYKEFFCITNKNQYSIIIDFNQCLLRTIFLIPKYFLPKAPILFWIHGQIHPLIINKNGLPHKIYQKSLKKYNGVINICPAMEQIFKKQYPQLSQLSHVLCNPINLIEINSKKEALDQFKPDTMPPYILQVSRLDKAKGHAELIHIYHKLKQRGIKHKLFFIGDGGNRNELKKLIHKLNLQNDCFLLGMISNPYPYFKYADLFVHTSEREGLPTVLLESMACGTPVVAMDCPTGPKDILGENSEYGRLIPMHDKEAFADAVIELLTNHKQHAYYVQQGLKRVQDFSMETIAEQLNVLLNQIV